MKAWKKGAVIGGIWGLVSVIAWTVYSYSLIGSHVSQTSFGLNLAKFVFLPGYISGIITGSITNFLYHPTPPYTVNRLIQNISMIVFFLQGILIGAIILSQIARLLEKRKAVK